MDYFYQSTSGILNASFLIHFYILSLSFFFVFFFLDSMHFDHAVYHV